MIKNTGDDCWGLITANKEVWRRLEQLGKDWRICDTTGSVGISLEKTGAALRRLGQPGEYWKGVGQLGNGWISHDKTGSALRRLKQPGSAWIRLELPRQDSLENNGKEWGILERSGAAWKWQDKQ